MFTFVTTRRLLIIEHAVVNLPLVNPHEETPTTPAAHSESDDSNAANTGEENDD